MKARLSSATEVWWLSDERVDYSVEARNTGRSEEFTVVRSDGELLLEGEERTRVIEALLKQTREGRAHDFRHDLAEWEL